MKILIVGGSKVWAIENYYKNYLAEAGAPVEIFPIQDLFFQKAVNNPFIRIKRRLGFLSVYNALNKELKEKIIAFSPDVVWIFKGMEVQAITLRWIKTLGIKLVNYNPDSPFIFSGRGSGNANVKSSIGLYNLHLTYNTAVKKEMETAFKIPTAILPFGFDVSDEVYSICSGLDEVVKVCFLGNPDKERGQFLEALAANGIRLDVYGNHWKKYVTHSGITVFDPVFGDELWKVLRKYRVQLNLMRPHNPDTHNMRSFEVPGIGGIQLAPDTLDHKTYFEPGKEIFLYQNMEECVQQIKKILALTITEADKIRQQARMRSIQSAYTYKDRAKQALEKMKMLYE